MDNNQGNDTEDNASEVGSGTVRLQGTQMVGGLRFRAVVLLEEVVVGDFSLNRQSGDDGCYRRWLRCYP